MRARRQVVADIEYISFICPGCTLQSGWDAYFHSIDTNGALKWTWNGSLEKPTINPSVLVWLEPRADSDEEEKKYIASRRCHSFVRDGRIEFLSDCGHALAGQTVDLPEIKEE